MLLPASSSSVPNWLETFRLTVRNGDPIKIAGNKKKKQYKKVHHSLFKDALSDAHKHKLDYQAIYIQHSIYFIFKR